MKFLLLFFLLPPQLFAQSSLPESKDLAGVWTGNLYNDTTQKYIHYELAINEANGKLNGYSHTTFIIDSVKNIGVKEVKIKWKKGVVSVEDDKLIDNDYAAPPAKGVRTFIEFVFSENGSTEILEGTWKTNRTKEFNAITGTVKLERNKKAWQTLIIPKLEQLGLAGNLSFLNVDKSSQSSIAVAEKQKQNNLKTIEIEKPSSTIISGKTESGKITPDTTITDPELVVKIYGPIKKKLVSPNDSSKIISSRHTTIRDVAQISAKELLPENLENKKAEVKMNEAGREVVAAKQVESNLDTIKPFAISSLPKKLSADERNNRNLAVTSRQNEKGSSLNEVKNQAQETVKKEIEPKATLKKSASQTRLDQKTDSVETDRNKLKGREVITSVENNVLVKKEESNQKADALKSSAKLPSKPVPIVSSNAVIQKKNEIAQSGIIEKDPVNKMEKEILQNSQSKKNVQGNLKELASRQDIEKNKIPEKDSVKIYGNQQQTKNVQTSINPLSRKIVANAAAEISKRDIETIRTVEVAQDSLVLSLYDNGTIDGDTVSILLNGNVVMPKVGLMARAVNKTIYLTPEMGDSIRIIMYAENLGTFPPNTGLLIVRDGDVNYEIRFSGDLKKNSAIILKRKKSKLEH